MAETPREGGALAARKPPKTYRLVVEDGPDQVRAVSLALRILQVVKAPSWQVLAQRVADNEPSTMKSLGTLRLDAEQVALLSHHEAVFGVLTGPDGSMVSLLACPECGRFIPVVGSRKPTSCVMTWGCEGRPVKAKPAAKAEVPFEVDLLAEPDGKPDDDGGAPSEAVPFDLGED